MKTHGSNMGIDTADHGVITHLRYCHHAELSMQMHGRIGWQKADGGSVSKGCSFNVDGVSTGSGVLHQEVKMDLKETLIDQEAFREELKTRS